jgi:hypothetical protein
VGVLWGWLLANGVSIRFAHRTFQWTNEARGVAAVHCVIVGFGLEEPADRVIFSYDHVRGAAHPVAAENINPYLVDAPTVLVTRRTRPICAVPEANYGSMGIDNGNLILEGEERREIIAECPEMRPFIRSFVGGEEFLNGGERYCLWLVDCPPAYLRACALVRARIEANRAYRKSSGRATTNKLADQPALFGEIRQPAGRYLLIPKVSSESRVYMPIGFMAPSTIASGSTLIVPGAGHYEFGVLQSAMHLAWMRAVCGRLESRYQYSAGIVYNTFCWPENLASQRREAVESAAKAVLEVRGEFRSTTLADLYDPASMPVRLLRAHQKLDAAVDAAYGMRSPKSDGDRTRYLFGLYDRYTNLLANPRKKAAGGRGQSRVSRPRSSTAIVNPDSMSEHPSGEESPRQPG